MATVNLQYNKRMQEGHKCPACDNEPATLPAITPMLIGGKLAFGGKYLVGAKCHKKQWALYNGRPASEYRG
ncbi:hypothetical protein LCGC14_0588010 [marine sediment metagenome]|uniref:Uncharacterized protein n=1 Tax=marine sediment metagenome TaxID=412755 RepID=A0A0F9UMR1_9ZZZZ